MATKVEIFREHLEAYLSGSKEDRGRILDAVCGVTRMHRKAAIRKFNALQMRDDAHKEQCGRATYYTKDVTAALHEVWEAGNRVCGELLHPVIAEYVRIFKRDRMWRHGEETTGKLLRMSERTVKRRIGNFTRILRGNRGLAGTTPSALKQLVPIFTGPWKGMPPGYGQIDTVVHCGASLLGDLVHTVNYTDAATLATFPRAQWNKSQEATQRSMAAIQHALPFPWRGVHPDTGSEFINRFVIDWCRSARIDLSRSRPGKKNDNMYVEERNGHVIRKHVGYLRLDTERAVAALNAFYDALSPYLFHFVAVRRTARKERIGARYVRRYEPTAQTPYQRTLEHSAVSADVKARLRAEHEVLNPLVLAREMERRLEIVYALQKRYGKSRN